jgi:hypothetical protein
METFLQLETTWIKPSDRIDGWDYQFIMMIDQSGQMIDMGELDTWCEANLSEWKRERVNVLVKTEDDAFRFKLRFC